MVFVAWVHFDIYGCWRGNLVMLLLPRKAVHLARSVFFKALCIERISRSKSYQKYSLPEMCKNYCIQKA